MKNMQNDAGNLGYLLKQKFPNDAISYILVWDSPKI